MGNWDLIITYDKQATDWLAAEGYSHPPARPGNRLPTTAEIEAAAATLQGQLDGILVDTGVSNCLRIRGNLAQELKLLRLLSKTAGQLWLYPDCGSPAIVVDHDIDPESVAATWLRALAAPDSWAAFLGSA